MAHANDIHPDTNQWYVVHCKHCNERRTALVLHDLLGIETYLPEVRRQSRGKLRRMPLFPGYLFALTNLGDVALSQINATPGVLRLVSFGNQPQPMPLMAVDLIRARVNELNAQGGMVLHPYRPGDVVRIKHGPLQGIEAVFTGPIEPSERVRLLIDFLGQLCAADVAIHLLEHSDSVPPPKRKRRTRGKGRLVRAKG